MQQNSQQNLKYKIVFTGEIQQGQDLLSVKTRMAGLLSASGDMVEHLFIGAPVLVKGNLTLDEARLFQMKFEKTGARCQLLEASSIPIPAMQVAATSFGRSADSPPPPAPQQPSQQSSQQSSTQSSVQSSTPSSSAAVPPVPAAVPAAPPVAAAVQASREFTFRKPEKKSKAPVILGILAILIIVSVIINYTERRRQTAAINRYRTTVTQPRIPGATGQRQAVKSALLENPLKQFADPKKYYTVELPGGYKVSNKSSGSKSMITFSYSSNVTVTIIARPMRKQWNPDIEMAKRVQAIQNRRAGPFSSYQIERSNLLGFNNMMGYELVLTRDTNIAHAFAMVSDTNIAIAVSIITMGSNSREYHETLENAIRDNLFPN